MSPLESPEDPMEDPEIVFLQHREDPLGSGRASLPYLRLLRNDPDIVRDIRRITRMAFWTGAVLGSGLTLLGIAAWALVVLPW